MLAQVKKPDEVDISQEFGSTFLEHRNLGWQRDMAHQAHCLFLFVELPLIVVLDFLFHTRVFPILNLFAKFFHVFERFKLRFNTFKLQKLVVNLVFEVLCIVEELELL